MAKGLFAKLNVPPGSSLHAKVSPAEPPPAPDLWSADLFLRRANGGLDVHLTDADLRAGAEHPLPAGSPRFIGQLVVTFAGASRALVELSVVKPDGTPHGKKYREIHDAAPADAVALLIDIA
jgi:hypothetical protein